MAVVAVVVWLVPVVVWLVAAVVWLVAAVVWLVAAVAATHAHGHHGHLCHLYHLQAPATSPFGWASAWRLALCAFRALSVRIPSQGRLCCQQLLCHLPRSPLSSCQSLCRPLFDLGTVCPIFSSP